MHTFIATADIPRVATQAEVGWCSSAGGASRTIPPDAGGDQQS
jgi:hypothetical protein